MPRFVPLLVFLATAMTLPQATVAADVHHGETIAKRWCAACHIVSREQSHGSAAAPPFSAIAKRSGFDDAKLALFLLAPHPKMPDMTLSRVEAADLAAYIVSQ